MENIKISKKIYNIAICILSIVSVIFAFIDFTKGLTKTELIIDYCIYILFLLDYIIRFMIADKKKTFIKSNILDLIAIIPFNSAFRIFRTFKILKVAKLFKLVRIGSVSARSLSKTKRFFNTNGFKYVLMVTASAIIISSLAMMYFEHMTFQDSLWGSFVTATTVGYGDLSPATGAGRIIASLLMLVGIGLIGSLTSSITSFFLNTDDKVDSVHSDKIDMVMTLYDKLSDAEKQIFIDSVTTKDTKDSTTDT